MTKLFGLTLAALLATTAMARADDDDAMPLAGNGGPVSIRYEQQLFSDGYAQFFLATDYRGASGWGARCGLSLDDFLFLRATAARATALALALQRAGLHRDELGRLFHAGCRPCAMSFSVKVAGRPSFSNSRNFGTSRVMPSVALAPAQLCATRRT